MALTVNTNVSSLNAQRNLGTSQMSLNTSLQRLSSGLRINSAKDDAAGLAISERFTAQIRGNEQASRNANDGISLAQTAEGALSEIGNNLQRMRELAVQSSNATNSDSDRSAINAEIQALSTEIDRVAQSSSFNGTKLLDGSFASKAFQVGANNQASDSIAITGIASARTSSLGGVTGTQSATVTGAVPGTPAALNAGDLTLNGIQVGASTAGGSAGQSAASAYSIAAAINAVSGQSGVTASAQATNTGAGALATTFGAVAANTLSINGVNVGAIAAGGDAIGQGANVAASINAVSSQTGVVATADNTGAVTLAAADGRDIKVAGATADTGLTDATTTSTINLESTKDIMISGALPDSAGLAAATGNNAATVGAKVSTIADMNVLTATNALKALDTIDGALATINSSRAALGAYQSRFASVVANQQITVENLSASRGRIQDADFAKETANLSRAQVLQQAGTAMLSQANQSSQGVLSLLR